MKSIVELLAEHAGKCEKNEATYIEVRSFVEHRLRKAQAIRGALDSFELKLSKASAELDQELVVIDQNFKTSA